MPHRRVNLLDPHYKPILLKTIAVFALVILAGLLMKNLKEGETSLVLMSLSIMVLILANLHAVNRGTSMPVPNPLILYLTGAGICFGIFQIGPLSAFWTHPAVLFSFFVLSPNGACIFSALLISATTALAAQYWGIEISTRFAASLIMNVLFINLMVRKIAVLNEKLVDQTYRDPLTGCRNRRYLVLLEEIYADTHKGIFILTLDIDHFKMVNDTFGHSFGDLVLQNVVTAVRRTIRKEDHLIRIGGDEFTIVLHKANRQLAREMAERIRISVASSQNKYLEQITLSVGVSEVPENSTIAKEIWIADTALYRSKEAGRDKVSMSG